MLSQIRQNGLPSWAYKAALLLAAAIWGMGTVVIKSTVDEFPPAWIVGVRFTLAGIILGIATAPRISRAFARNKRGHLRDGAVLGVVSDRYQVVQNAEAFAFTDALIGGEGQVHYETAGSLMGGRKIWLLAKLPDTEIVGDKTEPYLCFSNTHDGSGAIRVCMTPIRVVCNNTLRHTGDIQAKLQEARMCLDMANKYMDKLAVYADQMANKTVTDEQLAKILDEMFPATDDMSEREKRNATKAREEYMICYFAPDILKFKGTAWGALNAMSDMVGHTAPRRMTSNYQENNWGRIMDGHAMMDKMASLLAGVGTR